MNDSVFKMCMAVLLGLLFGLILVMLALAVDKHKRKHEPPLVEFCLVGRQYVMYQADGPRLAMVLTRRDGRATLATCGSEQPADLTEEARKVLENLYQIGGLKDE
jgi:hypothetical protein